MQTKPIDELKPGDKTTIEVAGQPLFIEPIPFGRLKKLMKLVATSIQELSSTPDQSDLNVLTTFPDVADEKLVEILPLIFDPKKHAFLSPEWIQDNLTIPVAKEIYEKVIKVNGLEDFLNKAKGPSPRPPVERPLVANGQRGEIPNQSPAMAKTS